MSERIDMCSLYHQMNLNVSSSFVCFSVVKHPAQEYFTYIIHQKFVVT